MERESYVQKYLDGCRGDESRELELLKGYIMHLNNNDKRTKEQRLSDFNRRLFWLVTLLERRRPNDSNPNRLRRVMATVKGYDNKILLEEAGPFIYKFRREIIGREDDFFSIDLMKKEISNNGASNQKHNEFALELFIMSRTEYDKMRPEEQKDIQDKLLELLNDYFLYIMADS